MNTTNTSNKTTATTAPDIQNAAANINRLHREVQRLCAESREKLDAALATAWHAGKLLATQRQHLRETAGRGQWRVWLQAAFAGGRSTAYRYMKLAREVPDPAALRGLSLRQAYFRLGIATEPKATEHVHPVQMLPAPVILAQKLLILLRKKQKLSDGCMSDLAMLYRQLRTIFETPRSNSSISPEKTPVLSRKNPVFIQDGVGSVPITCHSHTYANCATHVITAPFH